MFRHPRTGGATISTFSGENCTFGQGSTENGWAYVKRELNAITPVRASHRLGSSFWRSLLIRLRW